jgi:hypothetical protein
MTSSDDVYEMLWDCRYCGTKKLLGLSHRHCPNCGGPQEGAERYFPSDAEKIRVKDHVYFGADVICPACGNSSSRRSKHCPSCGSPLEGGKGHAQRHDQVHAAGVTYAGESSAAARQEIGALAAPAAPAAKPKRSLVLPLALGCGGIVLFGIISLVLVMVLWKKESALEVKGHDWQREIAIERFGPVSDSAWCDQMPSGARNVSRSREVRSHDKVQDGEDCNTRKIDNGDGTYREKRECTPRYKEEPVYAEKCRYQIERWHAARSEKSAGTSLSPAPSWPSVKLAREGSSIGSEREGKRSESYTVRFVDTSTHDEMTCTLEERRWAAMAPGSHWTGNVSVVGGVLDCDSLRKK